MLTLLRRTVAGRFFSLFVGLSLVWLGLFLVAIGLYSSPFLIHRERLRLEIWHLQLEAEILSLSEEGDFQVDRIGSYPPLSFTLANGRTVEVSLDCLVEVPEAVSYKNQKSPDLQPETGVSFVSRLPFCEDYLVSTTEVRYTDILQEPAFLSRTITLGGAFFLIILVAPFIASNLVTRPLRRLQEGTHRIAGGDLKFRVATEDPTEIGALARDFNEMAARLQQREADLIRASELKSRFLAILSHELRTPLTSIHGYGRLLLDELHGPLNPDQTEALLTIERNSEALMKLIEDLLDISRIEADRLKVEMASVPLQEVVAEVKETLDPLFEAKGLNLVLAQPSDPVLARVDRARLRQVLLNLGTNALKFTRQGQVTMRILASATIEVEDTGPGIAPDHLAQIFEPFYQVEGYQKREHGGAGLGLAISYRLVNLMEGRLEVDSTEGEGSTFRILLSSPGLGLRNGEARPNR